MQWVFRFIEGAHPNFGERSARAGILRTLGTLNALQLPREIPCERTSMQYMSPKRIGGGIEGLAAAATTSARTARFWRISERRCRRMPPATTR